LLGVSHCPIIKKRPALVRWSSGSVAGSVDAKVQLFLGMTKLFERKLLLCGQKTHFCCLNQQIANCTFLYRSTLGYICFLLYFWGKSFGIFEYCYYLCMTKSY
jgi:hypothetical protein